MKKNGTSRVGLTIEEIKYIADLNYPINLKQDLSEIQDLKGLEVIGDLRLWWNENPRFQIKIDLNTTKEQIKLFIDTLPNCFEISFFDFFHPQLSNPGAYVSVQHHGPSFLYMVGNHGWSSRWKKISKSKLIDYIYKNREHNDEHIGIFRIDRIAKIS